MEVKPLIGHSATNSIKLTPDQLGAPGSFGAFIVVPVLHGERARDEQKINDTENREFTCAIQLTHEAFRKFGVNGGFGACDGGSFLSPPPGANALLVDTSHGSFTIGANEAGELSIATMTVHATDIPGALTKFQSAVTPLLDHLSYVANVPVRTGIVRVHDRKNDVQHISFTNPFQQIVVKNHRDNVRVELITIYALYREARNSDSPFYKLLCYFKIMEGVGKLKGRVIKQARKRGVKLQVLDDVVPHHRDLAEDFRQYVGKSIKLFQDAILTRRYRDAVAHFELTDSSVLHVSSPSELMRFGEAAFAAELCVRVVIANYEELARAADDTNMKKQSSQNVAEH